MHSPSLLFTLRKLSAFIFIIFLDNPIPGHSSSIFHENENDKLALLSFKSLITEDPSRVLNSWNDSTHFCHWAGVRCNSKSLRVTVLNLNKQELAGTLSPHVGNLSFLEILDLSSNLFNGEIPLGLGNLHWLSIMNMSSNSLGGKIPSDLSNCSQLRYLALNQNNLTGNVPPQLGSLSELLILNLRTNNLHGTIPSSLGNLTSVLELHMASNSFYGKVPTTISRLKHLKILALSFNNVSGEFPPSLYNLSSLETISLPGNNFIGSLRNDIGFVLPNLKMLLLGNNAFTGYIPQSLPNASKLEIIDFVKNNFTGKVPLNLGSLKYVAYVSVGTNNLGKGEPNDLDFINSLTNCSYLHTLVLNDNNFGGLWPISIANLSEKLTILTLSNNFIHGNIPREISNLQCLTTLSVYSNYLSGNIPESVGMLTDLVVLDLSINQLTGKIPASVGNVTQLELLSFWANNLEGQIPQSLANCDQLLYFQLDQNNLNGTIPQELTSLSVVQWFTLSYNSLTGHFPENLGNWSSLVKIDLSYNKLSSKIPNSITSCLSLEEIYLQGNQLHGNIPESLALLQGLNYLDMSNNNLSGNIPVFLSNLSSLIYLNLSFNNLEGGVPSTGIFSNITAVDLSRNPNLCGGIPELYLPKCHKEGCPKSDTKKRLKSIRLILIIVLPASFVALSLLLLVIYLVRKKIKKSSSSSSSRIFNFYPKFSYQELVHATGGFSSQNLIGSGSFGTVYRGALTPSGEDVAVKVLNLERKGASKSFMAECEALKNIRHYNLVKVITACSSIDFQGNDFKAIVYQFMSKGNLNDWLHPEEEEEEEEGESGSKTLNIFQRIGIALDVASALDYIHHQCETPIIHCDLKPHNILLDDDMAAHVGDFGLARLIPNLKMIEDVNQFSSLGIKGTIGYAAPEYGMGAPVSIMGDVYSFGIVLLELISGKRPTDSFLQEKDLKLQEFVELALREQDIEVFDDASLCEEVTREAETWSEGWDYLTDEQIECLINILQIGVNCSAESPKNRMSMSQVYQELLVIRDAFHPRRISRRS